VQLSRLVAPGVVEYLPTGHGMHVAMDVAPVKGEKVPAGHGWHAASPVEFPYVPAEHGVHVFGDGRDVPAGHPEHDEAEVDPT
jgi:hypothetical protein